MFLPVFVFSVTITEYWRQASFIKKRDFFRSQFCRVQDMVCASAQLWYGLNSIRCLSGRRQKNQPISQETGELSGSFDDNSFNDKSFGNQRLWEIP